MTQSEGFIQLRRLSAPAIFILSLVFSALPSGSLRAQDVVWDGGAAGTGSAWTTAANWNPDGVPTSTNNAIFDSAQSTTIYTVNGGATGWQQQVGSITVGSGRTSVLSFRTLSSGTSGTMVLNGVNGVLLSNASSASLTFTNSATNNTVLSLAVAASGEFYCGNTILIYSSIGEVGGPRSIIKSGPGLLYLRNTNSYSGSTTVTGGDLEVDDVGTLGNGAGTLFLSGGNLLSGATRNGTSSGQAAIANPISITTDSYIYNKAGNANARFLAFSGSIGGSAGTLKLADLSQAGGNTFDVRFMGTFTFNRPLIVGEPGVDIIGTTTLLELANTNGVQTFTGDISGEGSIRRLNPLTSAANAGNSVFTGNNTYTGGTPISAGTLFANNTVGSALGSGNVIVTNFGTLSGNGFVTASTAVNTGGTVSPGSTATGIGNLTISDLTLGVGATYHWKIGAATGTPGVAWDLITASSDWVDVGSSGNPITIKIDSQGSTPTGWSSGTARDWTIIQSSSASGFDASHFALDTTAFSGSVQGVFSLSVVGNSLHLIYTPAADIVINVPSGTVTQGQTSPTPYPILTGTVGVQKVGNGEVILTNSLNNYLGSTKVYAGTATLAVDALNNSGAFGAASTAILLGNTIGNSNATININTPGVTMARSTVVQAGSSGSKTLGTTINSGVANFSGDVTLQDNLTLNAPAGASAVYTGNFTGAGGLTLGGGGSITLGAVNDYAGTTLLNGGTLNINAKAIGTNTFTIAAVSTLDNTGPASVTLNANPENWNANFTFTGTTNLNLGAGPVTLGGSRTLTVNNGTLTVGGTIGGNGGLSKLGAGTLAIGSPGTNSYTGGTTNSAGTLALNGTSTLGDTTGAFVLNGGNVVSTGTRSSLPIANPVLMSADTTIYGNSTATAPSTRIMPFSGNWSVSAGTLRIGNTGSSNNTFEFRFLSAMNVGWPIVVGDPNFDTPGAITVLEFYNDNTTPPQTVSGFISGNGSVRRGNLASGAGGTSVFTGNNNFTGGFTLDSGTLGIGLDSTSVAGAVTAGPLGTGIFEIDNDPAINIYASGGARTIGNVLFFNGVTNVTFTGTNALTFTGGGNIGTVSKTLTVNATAPVTLSGTLTNTAALTKAGSGTLVLSGDNSSRTNTTTVNAGTLLVNNTNGTGTGTGAVAVNFGGTVAGTGTIGGPVTISSGGTLGATGGIGTLTINGDLTLAGNVVVDVNRSSTPSNDVFAVSGLLVNNGAGTVTVNNLGPALAAGNKFQIFSGPVTGGDALTITGGSVTWTNLLAVDGSIQVVSGGAAQPPTFSTGAVKKLPDGNISLTASGSIGATYKLWATTNVDLAPVTNTWTLLQSGTISSNPFTISDVGATNFARRFYIFSAP